MEHFIRICLLLLLCTVTVYGSETSVSGNNKTNIHNSENMKQDAIKITAGGRTFTALLVKNSSTEALLNLLAEGDIAIEMEDYAHMEKVGSLGVQLPRNDKQTTVSPGDLILYQGRYLVIYYGYNSYTFTRLGRITDVTQQELKDTLGDGKLTVTLSSKINL